MQHREHNWTKSLLEEFRKIKTHLGDEVLYAAYSSYMCTIPTKHGCILISEESSFLHYSKHMPQSFYHETATCMLHFCHTVAPNTKANESLCHFQSCSDSEKLALSHRKLPREKWKRRVLPAESTHELARKRFYLSAEPPKEPPIEAQGCKQPSESSCL